MGAASAAVSGPSIIRYTGIAESPWINGGGSVKVIAAGTMNHAGGPQLERGERWDWRLSIAAVGQSGEFSRLPDIDRILTVVEGGPLQLTINGADHVIPAYRPFRFDGAADTMASLPCGPVKNLNLMCRAGHIEVEVSVVPLGEQPLWTQHVVVLLDGHAQAGKTRLRRFDTVFGSDSASIPVRGQGAAALIRLHRCSS